MSLLLLSTDACTLCGRALDLLTGMPELAGAPLRVIDIAADDALVERYGERLPVLAVARDGVLTATLDWPFDADAVSRWLAEIE